LDGRGMEDIAAKCFQSSAGSRPETASDMMAKLLCAGGDDSPEDEYSIPTLRDGTGRYQEI
jgi:hypothetical protein